eukprot:COSAG06_NODE_2091_length_7610_cov_2.766343_4_plen_665_part_00
MESDQIDIRDFYFLSTTEFEGTFAAHVSDQRKLAAAEAMKRQELLFVKAGARLRTRSQSRAWLQWAGMVEALKSQRRKVEQVLRRMRSLALHSALAGWQHRATEKMRLRNLLERAAARMMSGAVSRAFSNWAVAAARARRLGSIVANGVARWTMTRQSAAFSEWAASTDEQRRQRFLMERVVKRLQHRRLSASLDGWQHSHSISIRRRNLLRRASQRMATREITSALEGWVNFVDNSKRLQAVSAVVVTRLASRQLSVSWEQWTRFIAQRHSTEIQMLMSAATASPALASGNNGGGSGDGDNQASSTRTKQQQQQQQGQQQQQQQQGQQGQQQQLEEEKNETMAEVSYSSPPRQQGPAAQRPLFLDSLSPGLSISSAASAENSTGNGSAAGSQGVLVQDDEHRSAAAAPQMAADPSGLTDAGPSGSSWLSTLWKFALLVAAAIFLSCLLLPTELPMELEPQLEEGQAAASTAEAATSSTAATTTAAATAAAAAILEQQASQTLGNQAALSAQFEEPQRGHTEEETANVAGAAAAVGASGVDDNATAPATAASATPMPRSNGTHPPGDVMDSDGATTEAAPVPAAATEDLLSLTVLIPALLYLASSCCARHPQQQTMLPTASDMHLHGGRADGMNTGTLDQGAPQLSPREIVRLRCRMKSGNGGP